MPGISVEKLSITSEGKEVNKLYITAEESKEPEEAKVEGIIPAYVAGGKYLRVGPCKFDFQDFTVNHYLDGYGLLSKFEISTDNIKFEKKYVQSDAYKKAMAQQRPALNEFGTRGQADTKKGFLSKVISALLPEFTDNSYASLFQLGEDVFATCDTQFFHKIHSSKLTVECKCDTGKLFGLNGHCAHPLTDTNGDVYNLGFSVGATGMKVHIVKIPYAKTSEEMMKKAKIHATVSPRWSGQMGTAHSFGMTENYIIYVEQPLTVGLKRLAASLVKGDVLKDWLEWRPEEKNRFVIIEKSSGKVFKTEFLSAVSFYYLHYTNCYEESNQLVIDIVSYDSPNILDGMMLDYLRENKTDIPLDLPYIQRFVVPIIPDLKVANIRENLNLVNGINTTCTAIRSGNKIVLTGEKITGLGVDLPAMNKRFIGRKARYVYCATTVHKHDYSNSVCKVDLETREVLTWKMSENAFPGEPCFVPDPKGTKEDDGTIIFAVTDKRVGYDDFLIFLDAHTFKEIARAPFKTHLPASLHCLFLPN